MQSAIPIMGSVAEASTAMAGLILVFLGATSTSFDSYQKTEQKSVSARYRKRAWSAFLGLGFALVATFLSLIAQWSSSEGLAVAAFITFTVALVVVVSVAVTTILEIK